MSPRLSRRRRRWRSREWLRSEQRFLPLLVSLAGGIEAVGVEFHQHELAHHFGHFWLWNILAFIQWQLVQA